ncbi:DNA double-strand break repair nuclease NurA [Candidatus Woesearchaeota archaeon]|nr:DNA double-strand break repair nuclease NurA [Candidatus Woesearchaeota archaeon]
MHQTYNQIINLIRKNIFDSNDSYVHFPDKDYKPCQFNKNNFHEINIANSGKIAFIDAGSAEIIKSSNFSLGFFRIYCAIYSGNKRIVPKKQEFYAFASSKNIGNELYYNTEFIGFDKFDKNDFLFSSMDETIKQGIARANISSMMNVVRRFSELKMALDILKDLEKNDLIVLDGSLQCTFTNEKKYFEELYKKAAEKNIIICGLSKTTTLMTDKGNSIANALNKYGVEGKWLYYPVADIKSNSHKAEMAFVKLHEKSKYIFRFEIYKEQKEKIMQAVNMIADNCKDPVFVGYPYGLIEADKNARISNNEKGMIKTLFSVKFGKEWEKIKESLTSVDAHDVLDNIS